MENEIIWICDCSGSMSINGKLQSLIFAIKNATDLLINEKAIISTRMIQYSDHATWVIKEAESIEEFANKWESTYKLIPDTNIAPIELIFLIDTSTSMENEIASLKMECKNFISRVSQRGLAAKMAVVGVGIGNGIQDSKPFIKKVLGGNPQQAYTVGLTNLEEKEMFIQNLNSLQVGMFGERGCYFGQKSSVKVFEEVIHLFSNNDNQKVLIAITDDVGGFDGRAKIISLLRRNNISCSIIGKQDVNNVHSGIAKMTGGHFFDIEDDRTWAISFSSKLSKLSGYIAKEKSNGSNMSSAIDLFSEGIGNYLENENVKKNKHITVILVSDGKPSSDTTTSLNQFRSVSCGLNISTFAIGIGVDFDHDQLIKFVNDDNHRIFTAREPEALSQFVTYVSQKACGNTTDNFLATMEKSEFLW